MTRSSALIAVAAALLVPAASWSAEEAEEWAVEGHWWETCSCAAPCPCWKDEKPTLKDCPDMAFFHIDKGHAGKTRLDGARLVLVARSAEHKTMSASAAAKDFQIVNFYAPRAASPEVTAALVKLVAGFLGAGEAQGKKHAVKQVEMKIEDTADRLSLEIPGVLQVTLERLKDKPYPIDTTVAKWTGQGQLAKQVRYDFKDDGFEWKLKDRNAMYATVSASSKPAR